MSELPHHFVANRRDNTEVTTRCGIRSLKRLMPLHLGYRRNQTAGTWVVRRIDGGKDWTTRIGEADDFEDANGNTILDFWQAQENARTLVRPDRARENAAKPVTVDQALAAYEADLKTRGADIGNVARVRMHLSAILRDKPIALLALHELRRWRDASPRNWRPPASTAPAPA